MDINCEWADTGNMIVGGLMDLGEDFDPLGHL